MESPSISVFFPAYNDAGTIPSMVIAAIMTLRELTDDYEVIVVNDASQDHTGQMLADWYVLVCGSPQKGRLNLR